VDFLERHVSGVPDVDEVMKKILDPRNLPYFGAIVQAVLFALAGNSFFKSFGWLAGLGVGMVVNYSIALASSRISYIAEKRKVLAYVSLGCMVALSPTTITLSLFYPSEIYTAIAWAMCVDLSIILAGAIAGKALITFPQAVGKKKQVAAKKKKVARKRIAENELLAYLAENPGKSHNEIAEFFGVTRQAIGARMKTIDDALIIKKVEK
jgi:hypothetical protein